MFVSGVSTSSVPGRKEMRGVFARLAVQRTKARRMRWRSEESKDGTDPAERKRLKSKNK